MQLDEVAAGPVVLNSKQRRSKRRALRRKVLARWKSLLYERRRESGAPVKRQVQLWLVREQERAWRERNAAEEAASVQEQAAGAITEVYFGDGDYGMTSPTFGAEQAPEQSPSGSGRAAQAPEQEEWPALPPAASKRAAPQQEGARKSRASQGASGAATRSPVHDG